LTLQAEFQYKTKPTHISKQFKLAEKSQAPIGIMVGEEEIAMNSVRIKQLGLGEQSNGDQVERNKMVESIVELLKKLGHN
jgi:histidyl-tRNA synthetase